ncbi:MAG: TlyA family RNA methyltransferase, partial [Pseudonocardiaceae bacterium]
AQVDIAAGRVRVGGAFAPKASRLVAPGEPILIVDDGPRFVSRGGDKLAAALEAFGTVVSGRRALDVGASTGGFTDCLLQKGAKSVTALDVGHGQLHARLRGDPRVTVLERVNVRFVSPTSLGDTFDLVVADLAFISLRTVAATLVSLTASAGELVVLVKPQFEVGRSEASRGRGVIRDAHAWRSSLAGVRAGFEEAGASMMAVMASPLKGSSGNVEFLARIVRRTEH